MRALRIVAFWLPAAIIVGGFVFALWLAVPDK